MVIDLSSKIMPYLKYRRYGNTGERYIYMYASSRSVFEVRRNNDCRIGNRKIMYIV